MSVFRSFHRHDIDISSFHEAACTCNIDALRILKKHRNRVSKTYSHPQYHNHNTSLLHTAAAAGHPSLVDYLCRECLADIELGDTNGDTPLHLASRLNHYPVVKVLLNFGANPHSRNKFNETPLDLTQTHSETNRALLSSLQEDTFYNINLGNFNLGNSGKAIFIQATGQNEISTKTTQPKRKTKIQQFQPHYTWLNSTNKIKKGTVSTCTVPRVSGQVKTLKKFKVEIPAGVSAGNSFFVQFPSSCYGNITKTVIVPTGKKSGDHIYVESWI